MAVLPVLMNSIKRVMTALFCSRDMHALLSFQQTRVYHDYESSILSVLGFVNIIEHLCLPKCRQATKGRDLWRANTRYSNVQSFRRRHDSALSRPRSPSIRRLEEPKPPSVPLRS